MKAENLIFVAPAGSRTTALCAIPWDSEDDPYALAGVVKNGSVVVKKTVRVTYPGGPTSAAYLAFHDKDPAELRAEMAHGSMCAGLRVVGKISPGNLPELHSGTNGAARLVVPGATAKELASLVDQLTTRAKVEPEVVEDETPLTEKKKARRAPTRSEANA